MFRSKKILLWLLMGSFITLSGCGNDASKTYESPGTSMLSVSSDGKYALLARLDGRIVLWNLQTHQSKIITEHGNVFSVYFIKHSPYFMYQTLDQHDPQNIGGVYETLHAKPSLKQVKEIKLGKKIILTKENNQFFLYFYDNTEADEYKRIEVKPGAVGFEIVKYFDKFDNDFNPVYGDDEIKLTYYNRKEKFRKLLALYSWSPNNIVHVQNISGKDVLDFKNFPVYGNVMTSDLKHYFASDPVWNLYTDYGKDQRKIANTWLTYYGFGKLLNLTLSDDNGYLVTSGSGGAEGSQFPINKPHGLENLDDVVLWEVNTGKPLHKFIGNSAKTFATISPDSRYIVSGDEDTLGFVWNTKTYKKKFDLWSLTEGGNPIKWNKNGAPIAWNKQGLITAPKFFKDFNFSYHVDISPAILAMKFIDKTHYLRFTTYFSSAILYSIDDPRPIKYFYLGDSPMPAINVYTQDQAFDTAPGKHLLVMAMMGRDDGIIVYKYNPKKQTLKRTWEGYFDKVKAKKKLEYDCKFTIHVMDRRCKDIDTVTH